jgi:hypothetical protein
MDLRVDPAADIGYAVMMTSQAARVPCEALIERAAAS